MIRRKTGFFLVAVLAAGAPSVGKARDFSRVTIPVNGAPAGIAVADFDGDGRMDLAVAADSLHLFKGLASGEFVPLLADIPAGENPVDLDAGDFNEDGCLDIVIANHDTEYLTVVLSSCREGYAVASRSRVPIGARPHPHAVRTVDVNGDGHADLVTDSRDGESLNVLFGDGRGHFASPGIDIAAGGDPYRGFEVGDLNGDGYPDFVTPNGGAVGIILSLDRGIYEMKPEGGVPVGRTSSVALGDMTGDGHTDIAVALEPSGGTVLAGDGRGGFAEDPAYRFSTRPGESNGTVTGDLDGDGNGDAVVASYQSPEISVLWGGSSGITRTVLRAGLNPWGLAVADLDANGRDDIIVGNAGDRTLNIFFSRSGP